MTENVWTTAHLIGSSDIEIDTYFENEEKYIDFLEELRSKFSDLIKNYETIKYHEDFKYNLFPVDIE